MRKLYLIFILFIFCGISIFGDNDEQEEIDFLLFLPNSGNMFVYEEQAAVQLDSLARYLSSKNLTSGQIIVYGYAAYAPNDIEDAVLSRERAAFVINELQKRGISEDLFSAPVGYGSVYIWGNNSSEDDRKPNRRVRILLDSESPVLITPEIISETKIEIETETEIETTSFDSVIEEPVTQINIPEKSNFKFPWWVLLFLLLPIIAMILFPLLKNRPRKPVNQRLRPKEAAAPVIVKKDEPVVQVNAKKDEPVVQPPERATAVATDKSVVNLDEEIRLRAYELYQKRNGQNGDMDQDWYNALPEITAKYKADGYSVYMEGGYWLASRTVKRNIW